MKRSLMQIYVKNSVEAMNFYQKALGAKVIADYRFANGTIEHAELDIHGQILSLSEFSPEFGDFAPGTTMQFCLHFGKGNENFVQQAYEALSVDALKPGELGKISFSPLFFALTDKFGVNWCVFV